jgi:hypothetical protein
MPARLGPLCNGARASSSWIAATTVSSITVGARKLAPPWTTRCPTASTGNVAAATHSAMRRTPSSWSGTAAVARSGSPPAASN